MIPETDLIASLRCVRRKGNELTAVDVALSYEATTFDTLTCRLYAVDKNMVRWLAN